MYEAMNYYCYRIMTRQNKFNTLLKYGMLTNQYLGHQYVKIELEQSDETEGGKLHSMTAH